MVRWCGGACVRDVPQSRRIPNGLTHAANTAKHAMVMTALRPNAGQKPNRASNAGNTRNIGNVGTTYQNVYHAWLAISSAR